MDLINCIDRIPYSLNEIVKTYGNNKEIFSNQNVRVINIIGSGTSHTSGELAKYFIEENSHIECRVEYPQLFKNKIKKYNIKEDEAFIFVSQTGYTKVVYDSLKIVKDLGGKTISISEDKDSPIAKEADIFYDMLTFNEEFVFRTLGYTCTTLILCLIGLRLGRIDTSPYVYDLKYTIDNLINVKNFAADWFEKNGDKFVASDAFLFVGSEILYFVAKEFEIKFMEMLPIMSNSFELEESIHGPQNCFNNNMSFFILDKNEKIKSNSLQEFIENEITDKVVNFGDIGEKGKYFYFIEYSYLMQYLAYFFAKKKNRNLNERLNSNIDKYIKKLM